MQLLCGDTCYVSNYIMKIAILIEFHLIVFCRFSSSKDRNDLVVLFVVN